MAEFQEIRKLTIDFETALKELNFIPPSDGNDDKLSKFADNVEVHFASRKKIQILARARNMLLQSNFSLPQVRIYLKSCICYLLAVLVSFIQLTYFLQGHTTRTLRVNKEELAENISNHVVLLFSSEKCVVSEAAKQLMEVVHQTLKVRLVQPATPCLFSLFQFVFSVSSMQTYVVAMESTKLILGVLDTIKLQYSLWFG